MKKILLSLIMAIIATASALAIDKYTINREELPEAARQMLETYFPKVKIGMIKVDRHLLKKTDYDVRLVNGTTIEFNNAGKWTSVDCKTREVPEGLIMKPIRNYVKKNFDNLKIVRIEKEKNGYEVELSDGVELEFNLLGIYKSAKFDD